MPTKRAAVLALVAVAFAIALVAANAALVANATVADREFTTDALTDDRVYELLDGEVRTATHEVQFHDGVRDLLPTFEVVLSRSLTEEYYRDQVRTNVHALYEFLEGDRESVELVLDLRPVTEGIEDDLEAKFRETDPADLGFEDAAAMAESEAAFEREQSTFRSRHKERIQAETDQSLSEEELEAELDDQMPEIREELVAETRSDARESAPEGFEEPYAEFSTVRIGALTTDMSYESYLDEYGEGRGDLAAALAELTLAYLDRDLPDRVAIDVVDRGELAALQWGYRLVVVLGYLLPLVALAAGATALRIAPSPSTGALVVGATAMIVNGTAAIAAWVVATATAPVDGTPAGEFVLVVVFLEGILDSLAAHSAAFLFLGALVFAVGLVQSLELRLGAERGSGE